MNNGNGTGGGGNVDAAAVTPVSGTTDEKTRMKPYEMQDVETEENGVKETATKSSAGEPIGSGQEKTDKKVVPTPPASLFEFIRHFYTAKAPVSEKYRDYFKDIEGNISAEDMEALYAQAVEADTEYSKTLSLAEFVLETPGKINHCDQIMSFVQRIASNVGSLSTTQSNAEFQNWLDDDSALSMKLNFFVSQIKCITDGTNKQGGPKPLSEKRKNNLSSIAAMWLYRKGEALLPELADHLLNTSLNLQGVADPSVDSAAFSFTASMVKSTNKKKFAFFLDYMRRTEKALMETSRAVSAQNNELSLRMATLCQELAETCEAREVSIAKNMRLNSEIESLKEANHTLNERLQHSSAHHGADLDSASSHHQTTLKQLMGNVELAKTALSRGPEKTHIVEYQLSELVDRLHKEMK